jgi:hypothetical protein
MHDGFFRFLRLVRSITGSNQIGASAAGGTMDSPGLGWLADCGWPGLVFARGVSEDQVLRAFGADPDEAGLREPGEPVPVPEGMTEAAPVIRVGQAGDWVIVIEEDDPPQGIRPEVLRRVSAGGGAAVALHWDIGKFNHQFGYAADGDVIAALVTTVPVSWSGSDPDCFDSLARELGLTGNADEDDDLDEWEAVLVLAEVVFGLRLSPSDLERPMRSARILPPLADLPLAPPPGQEFHIGNDPVLDLLLNRAGRLALTGIAAVRIRCLMAETGLDAYPELVTAVADAVAGQGRPPADEDPAGKALRQLAREKEEAERYLAMLRNGHRPPFPAEELPLRVRRGYAARLVRLLLDRDNPGQILASEVTDRQIWDAKGWQEPLSWRPRFIADFRDVEIPPAELRAAEDAWLAGPEPVRGRWGLISPEPVRAHVAALIAAGMEPERIVEVAGGITVHFIDGLLRGAMPYIRINDARNLLLIRA